MYMFNLYIVYITIMQKQEEYKLESFTLFEVPSFVKEASADSFDLQKEGGVVVDGYRIDNKAAVWSALADIRKDEIEGTPSISKEASDKVLEAANLFGITSDMFNMSPVKGGRFIVKEANYAVEYTILDNESFEQAVDATLSKRASYPVAFGRKCANELVDIKFSNDYTIDADKLNSLYKLAGTADFNSEGVCNALNKRASCAYKYGKIQEGRSLEKLASSCAKLPRNASAIAVTSIVNSVDEYDHSSGMITKLAYEGLDFIENTAYLTRNEAILKKASEEVYVDDVNSLARRFLMIEDNRLGMQKWASDNGYSTTDEASDIVDCVSSMPESLRVEFCNLYK